MSTIKALFAAVICSSGLITATSANAALTLNPGGWGVYDDHLNLTWLRDANLAATNTFGVSGINANGSMTWNTAQSWIGAMNTANYLGFNDWRLPTVFAGREGCMFAYSHSNCGYNVNTATGEMAHLWYDELGNKAYYNTAGSGPQPGWGLTNTGPFSNVQSNNYWSGTEYEPDTGASWRFGTGYGSQDMHYKGHNMFAWAVRDGQSAPAVPEPETYAMLLAGLGLLGFTTRRRNRGV